MQFMMVNWTQAQVSHEHMLVARNVAVQMLTGLIDETRVNFVHELCEGRLTRQKPGVMGGVGGTYFSVDFGQYNGRPHQAEFFVPRRALDLPMDDDIITVQTYDVKTGEPIGYPEDIDVPAVNRGKLRVQ